MGNSSNSQRDLFLADVHQHVGAGDADEHAADVERAGVGQEVHVGQLLAAAVRG